MLEFKDFSKNYGNKKAVDKLNLVIEEGDIYAFVGHNGAGKTTTLKAAAGILPFEEGDILIDGISILTNPILCKSKIAYLPDNPDLYDFLKTCEIKVYSFGKEKISLKISVKFDDISVNLFKS